MLTDLEEEKLNLFIKMWCIRPWSWCAGGFVPNDARRVDSMEFELNKNGIARPCPLFKGGRCTHIHHPSRIKEARIQDE